jgi:hypothetical protein
MNGVNVSSGPVAWLMGVARASSSSRTAATAADASPLTAEEAIQGSGMRLEPFRGAAAAEQQLLHVQGRVSGSREGGCGKEFDGKDSSMV